MIDSTDKKRHPEHL